MHTTLERKLHLSSIPKCFACSFWELVLSIPDQLQFGDRPVSWIYQWMFAKVHKEFLKLVFCRFNIVLHSHKDRRHLEALKYNEFCCSLIGFFLLSAPCFTPILCPWKNPQRTKIKPVLSSWILFLFSHLQSVMPHAIKVAAFTITEQSYHATIHMKSCNAFIDGEILGLEKDMKKLLGIKLSLLMFNIVESQNVIIIPSGISLMQDKETMKINT